LFFILFLMCKYCIICACGDCGSGMSYDVQRQLCCNPSKDLCCPSGSRPCSSMPGCSEWQITCPSGCCNERCECLTPPPGGMQEWTACVSGNSDCNSDGTIDCNTTDPSRVCFGGLCKAGATVFPFSDTCKEGWSDCDNDASTGSLEGGSGCECNTEGGQFTCCEGRCISTAKCQNPGHCNASSPCCPGYGCMDGTCTFCSDVVDVFDCYSCPVGCGFDNGTKKCTSCSNPFICNADNPCCCGYECDSGTGRCRSIIECENPEACGSDKPCCNGYGCLDGKCVPCGGRYGQSCDDCPQGCGYNISTQACTACLNPSKCNADNPCCCGYECNAEGTCIAKKVCLNPDRTDYGRCDYEHPCCLGYGCLDGRCQFCEPIGAESCNECPAGCAFNATGRSCAACQNPAHCSAGSPCCCGYECDSGTGRCKPQPYGPCSSNDRCRVCYPNGICGGVGTQACGSDSDCAGIVCSDGKCSGGAGCTSDDQCRTCDPANFQCGGRGAPCTEDGDCSDSACSGGSCCPAGIQWNSAQGCCWDESRRCCIDARGNCYITCTPGISIPQKCMTEDGCEGEKECIDGLWGKCIKMDPLCPSGGVECNYRGTMKACPAGVACSPNNCVDGWMCADPRFPEGSCKTSGACTTSSECCCGYQCYNGVCCVAGEWECFISCTEQSQCPAGYVCASGRCIRMS
ncbi:MAG: hypothetical protein QW112_00130, partial [Candidatus Micrarchaeia archaeon]